MKNARKILSVLLVLAAVFSLCACSDKSEGGKDETPSGSQSATPAPTYSITLPVAHNDTLDPFKDISSVNRSLVTLLYDGLVYIDESFTAQPLLISGYSNSGTLMSVTLRSDIRFSDGSAITADDVTYSYEKAKASSYYSARLSNIKSVAASGNTVSFELRAADFNALASLDFPIVKKGTVQTLDSKENLFNILPPIGAGRYIIKGNVPSATLVPNPYCNRSQTMSIGSIALFEVNDSDGMAYGLQIGNYDCWYNDLSSGQYTRVNAGLSVVPTNSLVYLAFNDDKAIFTENAVRCALSMMLDRDAIISQGFQGHAVSAVVPFNPSWSAMKNIPLSGKTSANTDGAKAILEKAGYTSINHYGYRCSNTKSLTCTLTVCKDNAFKLAAAQQIKEQLAKLNFNVKIIELSYKEYTEAIAKGNYEMYLGEVKIPANMNIAQFFTVGGTVGSALRLVDENEKEFVLCRDEYTALLSGSLSMSDFCRMFESEMPFIPVCYRCGLEIYSRDFSSQINGTCYDNFYNIDTWSVKTEESK
ncbi:MAG: hypothetical protein IJA87_02825 [Clostridia bacterium]|nr:hypothetical protein [Clostridia bacterium]